MIKVPGSVVVLMLLYTVGLLGLPIAGRAQGQPEARTYGTASDVVYAVPAHAFSGQDYFTNANIGSAAFRPYCSASNTCFLTAGVFLPAGAVVTRIELDACLDASVGAFVDANLFRLQRSLVFTPALAQVSTDDFDIVPPVCTNFPRSLATPEIIDNEHNYYVVQVIMSGATVDNNFQGVRIFYHLQVSPAPAVATFGDVPVGHPQRQYIEALVASGITAGCGGGNYCPDAPLTRGQMAVFLSKGLGLHFAP